MTNETLKTKDIPKDIHNPSAFPVFKTSNFCTGTGHHTSPPAVHWFQVAINILKSNTNNLSHIQNDLGHSLFRNRNYFPTFEDLPWNYEVANCAEYGKRFYCFVAEIVINVSHMTAGCPRCVAKDINGTEFVIAFDNYTFALDNYKLPEHIPVEERWYNENNFVLT